MSFDDKFELQTKVNLLYVYNEIDKPIEIYELNEIILNNNICDYFTLQKFNNDFIESNLVRIVVHGNTKQLVITDKGKQNLEILKDNISERVKKVIPNYLEKFLQKHSRQKVIFSKTFKKDAEYFVELKIQDINYEMINITMNVPSERLCKKISAIWDENAVEIYKNLLSIFE